MRERRTTRRLPTKKRFTILAKRSCTRLPAFRAMNRRCARPSNRKKATQRRPVAGREAAQSLAVAPAGKSRTGACRREAFPERERGAPQHHRRLLGLGEGRCMWGTQLARPFAQVQVENVTQIYFG